MNPVRRVFAAVFVAMFIVGGTTSCSAIGFPDSSKWVPDTTVTAALAKDRLNAFFAQVKTDTTPYLTNLQLAGEQMQ
jgi:hypothetical protein